MKRVFSLLPALIVHAVLLAQPSGRVTMGIYPECSNSISDQPYDLKVHNNADLYQYPVMQELLKQDYLALGASLRVYFMVKNDWYAIIHAGAGSDQYSSTLKYTYRNTDGTVSNLQTKERIDGAWGSFKAGIGKAFYFDENKRFMLMPELVAGADLLSYNRTYGNFNDYSSYNKLETGGQINLSMNYRIAGHLGVGLTWAKLLSAYYSRAEPENAYSNSPTEQKGVFTAGKIKAPLIGLLWYF